MVCGDRPIRARLVFDDHRMAQLLAQLLRQRARNEVHRAAGREGHDDACQLRLCTGQARACDGKRCGTGRKSTAIQTKSSHGSLLNY
ncbi:hypothetical protein D3C71_1846760 [compost metagenome]